MNTQYVLIAVILSALCTFALRLLPFLAMGQKINRSEGLAYLGAILPPAIMAVLIVYCLKDVPSLALTAGLPKILGVLATGVSYVWKHNTFLSIIVGTGVYMLLIQWV